MWRWFTVYLPDTVFIELFTPFINHRSVFCTEKINKTMSWLHLHIYLMDESNYLFDQNQIKKKYYQWREEMHFHIYLPPYLVEKDILQNQCIDLIKLVTYKLRCCTGQLCVLSNWIQLCHRQKKAKGWRNSLRTMMMTETTPSTTGKPTHSCPFPKQKHDIRPCLIDFDLCSLGMSQLSWTGKQTWGQWHRNITCVASLIRPNIDIALFLRWSSTMMSWA